MSITPSTLAWAIIMLLFLLSSDKDFSKEGMGAISKLPYQDWFAQYKKLLISHWTTPQLQCVVKFIDTFVFEAPVNEAIPASGTNFDDDVDAALA
ncbi:hypothetical protein J3R83DRAFT_7117 [Lanmaoa asiatica]|nr:hypothetical protein J3R83DRAFT_7117 [Lanmaoa asiatica]